MTYSVHFRKKVLAVKEKEQLSFSAISKKFSIGRNTVFSWTNKLHPQKRRDKKAIKMIGTIAIKSSLACNGIRLRVSCI